MPQPRPMIFSAVDGGVRMGTVLKFIAPKNTTFKQAVARQKLAAYGKELKMLAATLREQLAPLRKIGKQ